MISLVVAASANHVIGAQGKLPWSISDDLRRFKRLTLGKPVVMGRRTYESIGRPLPDRQNIVITRRPDYRAPGCTVVDSPGRALAAAGDAAEVMIIGGGEIYDLFFDKADRLYLTRVHTELDGDAHFPAVSDRDWRLVASEQHEAAEKNEFAFSFMTYERRC